MKQSEAMKQATAYNNLTPIQRLDILKAVGTRTKSGKVKAFMSIQRECFQYFVKNIYNK